MVLVQGLDDTTLTAEAQYFLIFSRSNKNFCLRLHYNGNSSFSFVNATKIYQFKAKDSEKEKYSLCLGNISGFLANNMKKERLNGFEYVFSLDYKAFDTSNIIDIHKYFVEKHDIK